MTLLRDRDTKWDSNLGVEGVCGQKVHSGFSITASGNPSELVDQTNTSNMLPCTIKGFWIMHGKGGNIKFKIDLTWVCLNIKNND